MSESKRIAHYEILEELGRGGFATVHRAHDTRMGREVAVKVISGNYARDFEFVKRFQREARAAANLRHPHIAPIA